MCYDEGEPLPGFCSASDFVSFKQGVGGSNPSQLIRALCARSRGDDSRAVAVILSFPSESPPRQFSGGVCSAIVVVGWGRNGDWEVMR